MTNIAEILKYCPKGMKLYSPIFGECTLYEINNNDKYYPIIVKTFINDVSTPMQFTKEGLYIDGCLDSECLLFPSKDQRDWYKFRLPVKKGDIMMIPNSNYTFIATGELYDNISPKYICGINLCGVFEISSNKRGWTTDFYIPASEKAKKELFNKMAEAGYRWNANTLELEEIKPKFKEGDVLIDKDNTLFLTTGVIEDDKIQVYRLFINGTFIDCGVSMCPVPISSLKLAPITDRNKCYSTLVKKGYKYDKKQHTLVKQEYKPFEKVLVRDNTNEKWSINIFSYYDEENEDFPYICLSSCYYYCIPYESNEHLLGTTNSPE